MNIAKRSGAKIRSKLTVKVHHRLKKAKIITTGITIGDDLRCLHYGSKMLLAGSKPASRTRIFITIGITCVLRNLGSGFAR